MKNYRVILLLSIALFILAACTSTEKPSKNIADLAKDTPSLSTLVSALVATDLVTTLEGAGPFTVFAPDNAAFTKLFEGEGVSDLDALIEKLGVNALKSILLNHVVSGTKAASTDLTNGQTITTEHGGTLFIGISDSKVTVNSANVTTADVEASNGIIHIIDLVLPTIIEVENFFYATLSGANEVPAVVTEGTGEVQLTLKESDNTFSLSGTYSGLSGAATMAHIHGPAEKTANAGVVVALTVTEGETAGSGSLSATGSFTAEQVADLQAGLFYVNVHTAANAPGEIRGQLGQP